MMIKDVILWIFLGINTVTDMKNRTIHVAIIFLFGITGTAMFVCGESPNLLSLAGGILAGVYLLMFSVVSRGAVGFGDGLVVAVTGIWLGGWKTIFVLMGGFLLAALVGIAGICAKRADKKSELPFVPFFTLSYLVFYIGGVL